jgi:hypothetical protein
MKTPTLVDMAIARIRSGESLLSATAWTWDRADSQDRLAVDDWIVATKHPLGMLPSTRERRFRILVDELYSNESA